MNIKGILLSVLSVLIPSIFLRKAQALLISSKRIRSLGIDAGKVPIPQAFFFEVRTKCNGTCAFCAAAVQSETREDLSMPFDLYSKVIDELKEMNYSGRIAYQVNNEPMIFKGLVKFVKYARKMLPDAWIQILSNGKNMIMAEELVAAGINELSINHYTKNQNAPIPLRLTEFREKVLLKYMKPEHIGIGHRPVTGNDGVFRFNIFHREINAVLNSRAGTAPNKTRPDPVTMGFCEFPFTQFNISADGTVSKCCSDLYFSIPMGNVTNQNVMEIWNGDMFNQVRDNLLKGNRDAYETCKNCDFFGVRGSEISRSFFSRVVYLLTR